MRIDRVLTFGGLTSCAMGGLFAIIALFKGREARQLQGVKHVETLTGEN